MAVCTHSTTSPEWRSFCEDEGSRGRGVPFYVDPRMRKERAARCGVDGEDSRMNEFSC